MNKDFSARVRAAYETAFGAFLGSSYVSNFNKYNQVYQVTMQLRPTDRADLHSLDRLFVRSAEGTMLPVSQFVTLRKEYMPQSLSRFNMVGSIGITGSVAQGSSTGDAIRAIREVAQKEMPAGYGIEFSGITREESQTGSNIIVIFLICVFFVYLIMVALYESLFIPLAVILGVPFGLMGALLFAQLFVVPALFVIFQTLQERFKPIEFQPSDDPLIIEEMKQIEAYHA